MMGAGIAHANASRGIACVLKDVSAEKAAAGLAAIRKVTAGQVKRGALDELGEAKLLALVTPTAEARALDGCELIVEAVFENRALKGEVTREAEPMLAPDGVFASNTSTLPISGLAAASARPERFVGLHFFSPVHRMKLVEIIRGKQTSEETIARAYDYVIALGKTPIVVNDSRGFFTSRVFGTFVMEGAAMLAEGIAAPLIEHAALAAGMPVGPLAVLDETSLALSVHVSSRRAPTGRPRVAPTCRRPARRWSRRWSRSSAGPGAPAAAASTTIRRARRKRSGPDSRRTSKGRRRRRHRHLEAAPALPPVDRDGALPGRRRADEHGRSEHRLDLRHRLSGLDRRRDPVRRLRRPAALPRQRHRPRQPPRRPLRDLRPIPSTRTTTPLS
jgi:3-hydroxyacyl-CoA dehydrogenase/enoyl-CoA hydratase/3-hydroxybutyryl-CoA epimerase